MKKILLVDNTPHHAFGQKHIIGALADAGHEIHVLVPDDKHYFKKISGSNIKVWSEIQEWGGLSLTNEIKRFFTLKRILRKIKPDLICSYTIKPNIYLSLITRKNRTPVIVNITGLGYVFMNSKILEYLFVLLYRFSLKNVKGIFFQNRDDFDIFHKWRITNTSHIIRIFPGDGVNLIKFSYVGIKPSVNVQFMYSGRLLWDKGIRELISAFRIVRQKYPFTKLIFIGNYFPSNPAAISPEIIQGWQKEGLIEYKGMVDNVFNVMKDIDCVILPSYREGMPRSLLEASSMGKPIITVDSVGCKDVVEDGITGYMAKTADVETLVLAMTKFIELPFDKKLEMGKSGRAKMEREFDQQIVIDKYTQVVNRLLGRLVN